MKRSPYASEIGGDRGALIRIEEKMRKISPTRDAWWSLRSERNRLRDATDVEWRAELGYGTRSDGSALSSWPQDTKARWRILRAFIEEHNGVRTGDVGRICPRLATIERANGKCGASLREWIVLVDDLLLDGWQYLFRDAVSLEPVERTKRFSLLVQGEGDYHWTIAMADLRKKDPPVIGYWLDEEQSRWRPTRESARRRPPYGTFPRITDFVRCMLETYATKLLPHPRLRHDQKKVEAPPPPAPPAEPLVVELVFEPAGSAPRPVAIDEVVAAVLGLGIDSQGTAKLTATRRYGGPAWIEMTFVDGGGVRMTHVSPGFVLDAESRARREDPVLSREEAAHALRFFAVDGRCDPELYWRNRSLKAPPVQPSPASVTTEQAQQEPTQKPQRRRRKIDESLARRLRPMVATQLDIKPKRVTAESRLVEDLGADPYDVVELMMWIEEELEIELPDSVAKDIETFGDLVDAVSEIRDE